MMGKGKLWIAWEDDSSIRSRVLAEELGAEYRALTLFDRSRLFGWMRYPIATLQTIWAVLTLRPQLLVVQNPSILLAFEAALLKPLFGYRLAIDLHTPFLPTAGLKKKIVDFLHEYGLRNCDAVVVSNAAYRQRVIRKTPKPVLVLPDRIPHLNGRSNRHALRGKHSILYICTFSVDEPWREVLAAAALLPEDTCIYVSGRSSLRNDEVPKNVILTGFLPLEDYQSLVRSVDAIMVLTTADENLVCGGYEAVAAGKPLILSDTSALRSYFSRGAVFTENRARAIADAITRAVARTNELAPEIEALRDELTVSWEKLWRELLVELGALPSRDRDPGRAAPAATIR